MPNNAHDTRESHVGAKKRNNVLMILIVVAIVAIGLFAGVKAFSYLRGNDANIAGDKYQAVFLTNGQVYFGKVAHVDDSYVKLSNIYYLQVQQQVQPTEEKKGEQPQVSLAKLGSELHGPEDTMYISRQQVLFWENLKTDGKVAKAINDYQKTNK